MTSKKCERCDKVIPKQRLKAIPETRLCVKCSEAVGGDYEVTIEEENHFKTAQSKVVILKKLRHIDKLE